MSLFTHIALENADHDAQPDIAATQTELEAGVSDQDMVQTEVEDMTAAIESAIDEAGNLEEIEDTLEESVESGEGVSEDTARVVDVAVESMRLRLQMPESIRSSRIVPSLESFGSTASRLTATQIALEGIVDTLKKVWETIKRVAAQVWEKIKSFLTGLFRSTGMLKKHLEALKAKASAVSAGAKPAKDKLDSKSLALSLGDGKAANLSTANEMAGNAEKILDASASFTQGLNKNAAEIIRALGSDNNYNIKADDLLSIVKDSFSKLPVVKDEKDKTTYGPFSGDKVFTLEIKSEGNDTAINFAMAKGESKLTEIEALNKSQLDGAIARALALVKVLEDRNKISGAADKASKLLQQVIDKGISIVGSADKAMASDSEAGKEALAERSKQHKQAQKSVRTFIGLSSRINSSFPGIAFSTAKAMADYVSLSINNLKDGKVEADDKLKLLGN